MTAIPRKNVHLDAVAAAALVVLWSSGFVGSEFGTRFAPAHTFLAWRFVAAAVLMVGWCWARGLLPTAAVVRRQMILGGLGQCGYLGAMVAGIGLGVSSGIASLIASMQPVVVAVLADKILGERTTPAQRAGLGIGIVGVALVVVSDLGGSNTPWWAFLLPAVAMLSLTSSTLLERRLRPTEPIALALTVQVCTSAVVFTTVSALAGDLEPPVTQGFWWAVLWTVVLSTFGAYGAYMFVVRRNGATRASALLYLSPPTTMVWAYVMFGDGLGVGGVCGLGVCAVGVGLVLRRPYSSARPYSPATASTSRSRSSCEAK